ncbi:MAG: hypothetical protein ACM3XM_13410 [Mycobacterium leprae]
MTKGPGLPPQEPLLPLPPPDDDPRVPGPEVPEGLPVDPQAGDPPPGLGGPFGLPIGPTGAEPPGIQISPDVLKGGGQIGPLSSPAAPIGGLTIESIFRDGGPIGGLASLFNIGGAPVNAGSWFIPGESVQAPGSLSGGVPIGGPSSIFNIGGAPIAILGGVFSGGLPLGGPVTQVFRGGSGPQPNTLFINTITPGGPIAAFFIGSGGAPIGVGTFGGGGLPISAAEAIAVVAANIQSRTASVSAPEVAFSGGQVAAPTPPIVVAQQGPTVSTIGGGLGVGGAPIA